MRTTPSRRRGREDPVREIDKAQCQEGPESKGQERRGASVSVCVCVGSGLLQEEESCIRRIWDADGGSIWPVSQETISGTGGRNRSSMFWIVDDKDFS